MTGLVGSLRSPQAGRDGPGRFGATRRRDRWWTAPLARGRSSRCATYLFISGIIWTPLYGTAYLVDGYLSRFSRR